MWRHPPARGKVNPQGHNGESSKKFIDYIALPVSPIDFDLLEFGVIFGVQKEPLGGTAPGGGGGGRTISAHFGAGSGGLLRSRCLRLRLAVASAVA